MSRTLQRGHARRHDDNDDDDNDDDEYLNNRQLSMDTYPDYYTEFSSASVPTRNGYRNICCYAWRRHFVSRGLLFADPEWEGDFQLTALNSRTNRIFAAVLSGAMVCCLVFLGVGYVKGNVDLASNGVDITTANQLTTLWLGVMAFLLLVSFVLHVVRYCVSSSKKALLTTLGTVSAFFAAYGFVPYSYEAEKLYLYVYQHVVVHFLNEVMGRNFSSFTDACAAANITASSGGYHGVNGAASYGTAGENSGHYNDTAFASISTQTRL